MGAHATGQDQSLIPVPTKYCQIETPEDVVVLVHTVVGDDLRGVGTRADQTVEVVYTRSDIEASAFGERVGGLPPVPTDTAFFTVGDDQRTLVWTGFEKNGIAIGVDANSAVPIAQLVEALQTLGLE